MENLTESNASFDLASVRAKPDLAPYACDYTKSAGRLIEEPSSPTRSDFQRDRDRIIHSDAFRRLMHKTQVFVHNEGDHFRTRLTHTIEVGQIARALARALRVDEDLAEALALVHDFGHTPFGHAGERVLNEELAQFGGFDHNAQSLRVVTQLERRYANFDGLNLTWETLEGLVKHNGPLIGRSLDETIPRSVAEYNAQHDLQLSTWPGVEAQCAAIADDIAYDNHDLDDGLRAGLFTLDDLQDVPISGALLVKVRNRYPKIAQARQAHELLRRQITRMVEDVITASTERLSALKPGSAKEVRQLGKSVVGFSEDLAEQDRGLKSFLMKKMYRHPDVTKAVDAAQDILRDLFRAYMSGESAMPEGEEWSLTGLSESDRAYRIADYLAGMTDRFAVSTHESLFDHTPQLR